VRSLYLASSEGLLLLSLKKNGHVLNHLLR
jgi:hypothetical protein